ncbi:APC family permease [Natronorubrum sulfidifaciens]|uniref:Cationic amino acid transporter n=1 Tax=Natronorubrum sulfidifaciens JCM 14089 TaxID=1230460 RepID=L9W6K8_9EURY|nr:APC family permease [Natronorubrum sulfidifaciens]ELY45089.1 cationic amino acid transporter [Natronorubrum sulfidifaciens JCM 14089]
MSETTQSGLEKALSSKEMLILSFGAMIGWGWIILAGDWINEGGPMGAITAFVAGGIVVGVVAIIYSELASSMPLVGGEHVYSLRALGPIGSFVCTWAIIFGYVTVAAFEAVALPSAMAFIVPGFDAIPLWNVAGEPVYATWIIVGVLGTIGITYLNYIGIRIAAQFQIIMTVVIAFAGLVLIAGAVTSGQPSPDPSFGAGTAGIFAVVLMTPFMFVGFDVIPQSAEEADIPARTLGLLIMLSVGMAALFYMAVIWGSSRALPGAELVDSSLPAAQAMEVLFDSTVAGQLMALAGIAGIMTSWNAFIIGGSRALFALAESGMIPEWLGKVHPEYNTPSNAILFIGGLSVIAPFFGEQMLTWIVNAGGLGIVIAWFLVVVSFLVLRYREPEMERPYKVPAGPVIGIVAFVATAIFITLYLPGGQSALVWPYEWLIVLGWCILGVVFYALSGEKSVETSEEVVQRIEALDDD